MPKKVKAIASRKFFRRLPFVRFVKQIVQDMPEPDVRVSSMALDGIQCITEEHLEDLMEYSKMALAHAERETLRKSDIELVRAIRRRPPMPALGEDDEESPRPSRVRPRRVIVDGEGCMTVKRSMTKRRLEGNESAISTPGIQRAAVKVGIERVGDEVYGHCEEVVKEYLKAFLADAIVSAKYNRRCTIKDADVEDAAERHPTL